MAIDVPEATQTRLEQTVKNWRLGQTLVISAGIHPGVLSNKGGWFNLPIPGTYPTGTEGSGFSRSRNRQPIQELVASG